MKLFFIILVLAAAAWMFASCYRPLLISGPWWRATFGLLTLAGLLCGASLVEWTRDESPTLKVTGYPFTIAAAEFVDGRWHGGLIAHYHLLAFVADFALAMLIFLGPFRLVHWLTRRFRNTDATQSTTVTDVSGFFFFLGLAALAMHWLPK